MIPTPQAHQALPNAPPKEPPAVTANCVHRVSPQTGHRLGVMPKKQNRKINFKLISIFNWTEEIKLLIMGAQHTIIIIHFDRHNQRLTRCRKHLQDLYNTEPH